MAKNKDKNEPLADVTLPEKEPVVQEEVKTSNYSGKEHWGVGGRFKVLANGRRVRVKEED